MQIPTNHINSNLANNKQIHIEHRVMEFRAMRRRRQQLSEAESIHILEKATSGTLALLGDGGYPYAVPISYVYADGKL